MIRTRPTLLIAIAFLLITAGTAGAASKVLIKSSSQVKNGSLDAADLSAKARKSLRGAAGAPGPAGPSGPAGPAGARGPSEAFAAQPANPNTSSCPSAGCSFETPLRALSVPAGSYLFTATAELAPKTFAPNAVKALQCLLTRGDTGDAQRSVHLYKAGPTPTNSDQTVAVTWALTLPAATTMTLTCAIENEPFSAMNARITALALGSLTTS